MKTDCNTIRREIDEAELDGQLRREVNEHLSSCDQCRRFHDERRTLRSLMADLETVAAPADFDFRLRARLARDKPSNGFHRLFLRAGPITAVALLLLIAGTVVLVKNWMSTANQTPIVRQIAHGKDGTTTDRGPTGTDTVSSIKGIPSSEVPAGNTAPPERVPHKSHNVNGAFDAVAQKGSNSAVGKVPRFNTKDSAGEGAPTITADTFVGLVVVPVDARELKLSIDNGRGGARTISLPPVTFGSQRLLAREASFVPKSTARSNW